MTTISTPHRGSFIADVGTNLVENGKAHDALGKLFKAFGRTFTTDDLANETNIRSVLSALSEKASPAFNAANPDDRRVYSPSWAGVSGSIGAPRTTSRNAGSDRSPDLRIAGLTHRRTYASPDLRIAGLTHRRIYASPDLRIAGFTHRRIYASSHELVVLPQPASGNTYVSAKKRPLFRSATDEGNSSECT